MDPRVGAWEPPGAEGSTSASVSQQSGSAGLSTDAQVWQPPALPRQQSMDSGGQSLRGSAEFYPSGANGSAQQHRKWVDPAAAAYYQESLAEDAATGAEMRGGLLVVESSAGPGDGADPPHYGGFQHTELYSARPNQPSYGSDAYQPHDFLSAHGAHEQHPRHLYSDEAAYDYAYGAMAFAHPQSFEHRQAAALDLYPPESSPSTASESLESPALVYSPGGTMYSLPGAGPAASSLSSPAAHSRTELQPPDVLQPRSHSAIFPPLSAPLLSSSPRLSVEIGAGLGSVEMPQQPVDYIGVVDFECTCDRIRSQARSDDGPEPEWVHEIIEFPLVLVDAVTLEPVDEFHAYIRPTERPVLTNFCKTLTGISQDTVDAADTLEVALGQFATWLTQRQLGAPGEPGSVFTIALATDGPWDIVNFLAPECERKGLPFPSCAKHWIDARAAFAEWHQIKQLNVQKMLEWSGMEFEGRPHSGIDDTRNIARIVTHLLSQGCVLHPNCDVTTTHAPLPWLGAGSMRPAAVRGSTEAVVRGSGGSSRDEADRSDAVDKGSSPNIRSDALSPSAVDEKLERALATTGSPRQQSKRSWSAEIDDVVEELVQRTLAAANESGWIISPRRAKRASGEGTAGEHIMDLVKELVERSLTESAPSREHGRADLMRNSLADLDGDEPSSPSGSPTRSGVRPAEMASTRPRDTAEDGGSVSGRHGGMSSPISPQIALARSLSEQERLRRAHAEAQAKLAWSEGDAIAHELQELQHEIDTEGRSSGQFRGVVGSGAVGQRRDEADKREDGHP